MATSVELARAVAAAFGLAEKTVLLHLKHVRPAGAITFKGHGKGAAAMTARDAAGLVIAVAGSAYAANAATTYRDFAGLKMLSGAAVTLDRHLEWLIERLRVGDSFRPPSGAPEFPGHRNVLAEACLKLTWVDGATGEERPRIATERHFLPGGGHTQRTFASESLAKGYYDEARLMQEYRGVRMTTTRAISLRALEQVAASL